MFALWYISLALDDLRKRLGWDSFFGFFKTNVENKPQIDDKKSNDVVKNVDIPKVVPDVPKEVPKTPELPKPQPVKKEEPKLPEVPKVPELPKELPKLPEVPKVPELPKELPKLPEVPKIPEIPKPQEVKKEEPKLPEPPKVPEAPKELPKLPEVPKVPELPKDEPKLPEVPKPALNGNKPDEFEQFNKTTPNFPKSFENGNMMTQEKKPQANMKDASNAFLEEESSAKAPQKRYRQQQNKPI